MKFIAEFVSSFANYYFYILAVVLIVATILNKTTPGETLRDRYYKAVDEELKEEEERK